MYDAMLEASECDQHHLQEQRREDRDREGIDDDTPDVLVEEIEDDRIDEEIDRPRDVPLLGARDDDLTIHASIIHVLASLSHPGANVVTARLLDRRAPEWPPRDECRTSRLLPCDFASPVAALA